MTFPNQNASLLGPGIGGMASVSSAAGRVNDTEAVPTVIADFRFIIGITCQFMGIVLPFLDSHRRRFQPPSGGFIFIVTRFPSRE